MPDAVTDPFVQADADWHAGRWAALAAAEATVVAAQPQRARIALRVAAALLQLGRAEDAGAWLARGLEWGGERREAARLLVDGLHNTLGRIAALRRDGAAMQRHFARAVAGGDPAAADRRALHELAALGLVGDAQALVGTRLAEIEQGRLRPGLVEARIEMLRSEVGLLQHELALARQRMRVAAPDAAGAVQDREQALRERSTSQLGQDLWVLRRSGYKRDGFFVEFGATDGVRLSNSYLLETEFGWRGICAEPNPKMYEELRRNRRCITTDACIGPRSGETVEFVLAEEYGGMVADMDGDAHAAKRNAYFADAANRRSFVTESLHDMLVRLGAPRDIDYLSVDTEGSEYAILAAFPFEHWNVRLLTVEHNYSPLRAKLRALLEPLGYRRTEAKWDDWYERVG